MSLLYLLGFLFLINGQVNSTPAVFVNIESVFEKFENWLTEKAHAFVSDITNIGLNVKLLFQSEITSGQNNIEKVTTTAINDLKTFEELIDKNCLEKGVKQLEQTKTATIWEFLHCANLSNAGKDVGDMFNETIKITNEILKYIGDATGGLSTCILGDYINDLACVSEHVWNAIKNIRTAIPDVSQYEEKMANLTQDIKSDVNYCLHPPEGNIKKQVDKILNDTKHCSTKVNHKL
uniref:Secreted protein n=1 Tax=Pristhesancus plagipennis TaxID=1955184 RepID=A0A2K8JVD2_PRIPG|nr:secreted hypothetical protein [Pristhesancus plagipennis]